MRKSAGVDSFGVPGLNSGILGLVMRLFFLLFLVACGDNGAQKRELLIVAEDIPAQSKTQYTVTDDLGRQVTLSKPARRIVALSPHITENLFSAGLGERIVATVDSADFPPSALAIPRVGGFADFSLESILAFEPDLVVGWSTGYLGFAELVKKLEAIGIAVFVDEPEDLPSIANSVKRLAILGGTWETSDAIQSRVSMFLSKQTEFQEVYGESAVKPKVFYQVAHDPLQTLGKIHIVSSLIELCGGQNIFSDSTVIAPQVNIETILDRKPDVIIFAGIEEQWESIQNYWQRWDLLEVVEHQRIYRVNPDWLSRHTLRMAKGAEQLCKLIDKVR